MKERKDAEAPGSEAAKRSQGLGSRNEEVWKKHQTAANEKRRWAGLDETESAKQSYGERGNGQQIPDDVKGRKVAIEHKARHVQHWKDKSDAQIKADMRNALEQNRNQLAAMDRSGEISGAQGNTLYTLYDNDNGRSSRELKQRYDKLVSQAHKDFLAKGADDPQEMELRQRVKKPQVTTAADLSRKTKRIEKGRER